VGRRAKIRRGIVYEPLPSQRQFHNLNCRFKGFSGPIGSGKSQALCQEAIRLTYLNPGRMGLLGAPTYAMLRDITQTALFETLDANEIPYEQNKAENAITLKDTRSRIVFRPLEDYERLRGTNLAWFGVDELTYTSEEAWLRLEGRLRDPKATRLCGFAVWTPKGHDWVYKRFIDRPKAGYKAILAKPAENRFLLEKVPDFYDRLADSYDQRFYQQEVLGEYLAADGNRVYSCFDRRLHVQPVQYKTGLPLLWALDFNVDPMCSVVVQRDGDEFRVLGEIMLRHATTRMACEEFLKRYGSSQGPVLIYGDAAGQHSQSTGSSDYEMIRDYFRAHARLRTEYRVPKANPAVRDRINKVNGLLQSAAGDVRLLIDPGCKGLIEDFEQVAYKGDSSQIDKDRDRMRTHLSDALGYLLYEVDKPPVGPRRNRLPVN